MSDSPRSDDSLIEATGVKPKCYERHIAVLRCLVLASEFSSYKIWQLQIWDWQYLTISNSVLSDVLQGTMDQMDFDFLGDNRFLFVNGGLKLYSIEDMSLPPQLLACFRMPVPLENIQCLFPMTDIDNSSQPRMQAQQTIYISDTKQRLLCIIASTPVFIVFTRFFFDLHEMVVATPIPWNRCGPRNTRMFDHDDKYYRVYVFGNRVLQTFPVNSSVDRYYMETEYMLRMMDFSSMAVTNRRGLGRVMKEPSSVQCSVPGKFEVLTITLPYVEIVWDRKFGFGQLEDIWLDRDSICVIKAGGYLERDVAGAPQPSRLEIIDI